MATKDKEPAGGAYDFRQQKPGPKVLRSLSIEPAENGGHIVEHRFENSTGPGYHPSENHIFGPDQGRELLTHIHDHLNVKVGAKK